MAPRAPPAVTADPRLLVALGSVSSVSSGQGKGLWLGMNIEYVIINDRPEVFVEYFCCSESENCSVMSDSL